MASAQSSNKLQSEIKVYTESSGDASTAKIIEAFDMRDFRNFLVQLTAIALTGVGVTVFKICAATAADGTGEVIVKQHAIGSAPDAVGDSIFLECTAEEVAQLAADAGTALRYVYAKVTTANAADRIACVHVLANYRHPKDGLTADAVA